MKIFEINNTHAFKKRSFLTKLAITSVAKFGDDNKIAILFCEYKENITIQIRDTNDGRVLNTFNCEKSPGAAFQFEDVGNYKMLCRGTNEILLSEYWKFHCFNISRSNYESYESDLHEAWYYESRIGKFLKDISGLTIDEEGNIYVCGSESHNIHQIEANDYLSYRVLNTQILMISSHYQLTAKGVIW